jgi:hypothetical protein
MSKPIPAVIAGVLALCLVALTPGAAGAHATADLAKAKKALLVLSDLPKGWTSSKASGGNEPLPDTAALASCTGIPVSVLNYNAPSVSSPQFMDKNQLLFAQDSVQIYPSAKSAQADFESLADQKTPGCMTTDFNGPGKAGFEKQVGGTIAGGIMVTRNPASYYAPHTANITMYFPEKVSGSMLNVELTIVDFVKGREEQTVSLIAFAPPFPTSLALHLTEVGDGRI